MLAVRIDGLAALQRRLLELPLRVEARVTRKAVSDGAAIVRDEMKRRAPVYTGAVAEGHPPPGTLKQSVFMKRVNAERTRTVYIVGCRHGKSRQHVGKKDRNLDAFYFFMVEFGTVKMAARPFMRPAFDSRKSEALAAMIDGFRRGISAEVASL